MRVRMQGGATPGRSSARHQREKARLNGSARNSGGGEGEVRHPPNPGGRLRVSGAACTCGGRGSGREAVRDFGGKGRNGAQPREGERHMCVSRFNIHTST